jgi:hypothetical protein
MTELALPPKRPDFDRDGWGRPKVKLPDAAKVIAYTRCTTFVDALDEKYKLSQWQQRMVAVGLSQRQDLLLGVSSLADLLLLPTDEVPKDAKQKADSYCEQAIEAARGTAAATTGTALHELTRALDEGRPIKVLPDTARADLESYAQATQGFRALYIEHPMVEDGLQIGGTPDRIVQFDGKVYIADVKTGSIEFGALKIAEQLAVYAHSTLYDPVARKRLKTPNIDKRRAIVIHLPAGKGQCQLRWVDIERGWQAVQVAKQVRMWRQARNWYQDIELDTSLFDESSRNLSGAPEAAMETHNRLRQLVSDASTVQELTDAWARNRDVWDDELTELAGQRKQELTQRKEPA